MKYIFVFCFVCICIVAQPSTLRSQNYDIDTLTYFGSDGPLRGQSVTPLFFVFNDSGALVICLDEHRWNYYSDIAIYNPVTGKVSLGQGANLSPDSAKIGLNVTSCFSDLIKLKDGRLFASTSEDTVIISSDGGNHWSVTYLGFHPGTRIHDLAASPKGYALAATSTGLYRYNEAGSWEYMNQPSQNISSIEKVFVTSNGNILAVLEHQYMMLSKDDGATWTIAYDSINLYAPFDGNAGRYLGPDAILEDKNGRLYFTGYEISISDDQGETWYEDIRYSVLYKRGGIAYRGMMFNSSNTKVLRSLVEIEESPDTLFANRYMVYDAGLNAYRRIKYAPNSFAALDQNDKMYLLHVKYSGIPDKPGTYLIGGILYTLKDYVASSTESLPEIFSLSSSYPNPVTSGAAVTLNYTLESAASLTLRVQDLLGRTVSEQSIGRLSPGEHSHSIPTQSLNPGMYFYTLLPSAGKPFTGKLVVR